MIIRNSVIALIILFLDWSSAVGQPLPVIRSNSRQCEPIGRVLSTGDRRWVVGSLLCQGDRLHSVDGSSIEVLCYLNRKVLWLGSGSVTNKCAPQAKQQAQQCTLTNRSNCPKPKGPREDSNAPALISPYSSAILNTRPNLSWYSVSGANSYTVQVSGADVNWEKEVGNLVLPYPKEQPALQPGNAYKITIIANQGDSSISASSSAVNVIPESEAKQIIATVKHIRSLNLPKDEEAFDLDTVYMSKNLLNETIDVLKAKVEAGNQNPTLYRVLGDRYLEAGLPDDAKREYTMATKLAKRIDNLAELAKAQAGLKRAKLYSQLPTRTKEPQ